MEIVITYAKMCKNIQIFVHMSLVCHYMWENMRYVDYLGICDIYCEYDFAYNWYLFLMYGIKTVHTTPVCLPYLVCTSLVENIAVS